MRLREIVLVAGILYGGSMVNVCAQEAAGANQSTQSSAAPETQPSPAPTTQPTVASADTKSAPAASPAPVTPTSSAVKSDEIQGISTLDIDEPQGNWLYKRIWWQRAEQQYEKTKGLVDSILDARMGFFSRRSELDRTVFDPFYLDTGLSRGVLEEVIETLVAKTKEKRDTAGSLTADERALESLILAERASLEQLQKDIQKISDVDHAVDDAIDALIKQINQARNFERQSWRNFKQIAQELNDKKARELYYGMVTYFQNINDIASYIQGPLSQHFNQLETLAKEQTVKVQQAMKMLKEKGVDLKKQSQQFDLSDAKQKAHEDTVATQPAQEQGIFSTVWSIGSSIVSSIAGGVRSVWNFTIGRFFKSATPELAIPTMPEAPKAAERAPEAAVGADQNLQKKISEMVPQITVPTMPVAPETPAPAAQHSTPAQ